MSRPLVATITSQLAAWDAPNSGNFTKLFSAPLPIHESASLTEANLQSTFAAAAYDRCLVWVNHTVFGYTLYRSNGMTWDPFDPRIKPRRAVTGAVTLTAADEVVICSSLPYTVTLDTVAACKGRTVTFKTTGAGTLTIDGSGAETIDGAATTTIVTQFGSVKLYCDGTAWHILSRYLT